MPEPDYKILQRGETLADLNRFREALAEFYKFLATQSENYMALCHIARCHYELNELKVALKFANAAITVAPEGEWAYRLKSFIFRASGNHRESLEAAEICVSKAPHSIYSLQTLVYAQLNNFRLDDAEKTLQLMLENAPDDALTHDAVGFLHVKREDYEAAEKHFLQALKINPESVNSLNNVGYIYLEKSQNVFGMFKKSEFGRKAKECFLSALRINPNFALARQNLQAAENNRFYLSSLKNRIIYKSFLFFISMIVFSRLVVELIPPVINFFMPYEPQLFIISNNVISIFFVILSLSHLFFLLRSGAIYENLQTTFGDSRKMIARYCVAVFVPQLIGGLFFAFVEMEMSLIAWLILLISGIGLLFAAIRLFQYFDERITE